MEHLRREADSGRFLWILISEGDAQREHSSFPRCLVRAKNRGSPHVQIVVALRARTASLQNGHDSYIHHDLLLIDNCDPLVEILIASHWLFPPHVTQRYPARPLNKGTYLRKTRKAHCNLIECLQSYARKDQGGRLWRAIPHLRRLLVNRFQIRH